MDKVLMWSRMVPGCKFKGCEYDNTLVWADTRPEPTQAEMDAEWAVYQAEETKKESDAEAYRVYFAAMEAGYKDANNVVWYCNERATMDLSMMVVLNTLDEAEPVYILSMSHGVQEMTYAKFKTLAVTIGRYAYGLRNQLWVSLLG